MHLFQQIKKDKILLVASLIAILTSLIVLPSKAYFSYINYKVLIVMFSIMITVTGLFEEDFFGFIAAFWVKRISQFKIIALTLVVLTFFLGMLMTNDAVLLTLIPFSVFIIKQTHQEKHLIKVVILQTFAANLGSALTPMGDPQNIYLYSNFSIPFMTFIQTMLPLSFFGLLLLLITTYVWVPNVVVTKTITTPRLHMKRLIPFFVCFFLTLLTILGAIDPVVLFGIVFVLVILFYRHLLRKIDLRLLLTFFVFFIATGNLGRITFIVDLIEPFLQNTTTVFFTGIITSQLISNVPAAVLLSTFVPPSLITALLIGVNIGAMGTLYASLASLITFKFVIHDYPHVTKEYLRTYTMLSIVYMVLLSLLYLLFFL